jgi:cholesterol oxidase
MEEYKIEFSETMAGYIAVGKTDFIEGHEEGKRQGNRFEFSVTFHIEDLEKFIASETRKAFMTGQVTCEKLFGKELLIEGGEFGLFWTDIQTKRKRISYHFYFKDRNQVRYRFYGYKQIGDDPGFDVLKDHITLYSTLYKIDGADEKPIASGIIYYPLWDLPHMILSLRTPKNDSLFNRMRMGMKFLSWVSAEVATEYVEPKLWYEADYTNLVCRGVSTSGETEFFLFSGVHEKGFPWGGEATFSDVGLIIREGRG